MLCPWHRFLDVGRVPLTFFLLVSTVAAASPGLSATTFANPDPEGVVIHEAQPRPSRSLARYISEGSVLARYDFEVDDPQGWQTVDAHAADYNHWHVDDFAGLDGGYAALSGAQSFWCGVRPEEVPPGWTYSDGYGNDWNDSFEVEPFAAPAGAILTMLLRYDLENLKDWLYVEYRHGDGPWEEIGAFTGRLNVTVEPELTIPAPLDPTDLTTVRWRVVTDDVGSDEYLGTKSNGAAVVDDILVRHALGEILRFADFEGESIGDPGTLNGWFFAVGREPTEVGDRGALVSGNTVFQEDPLGPNTGHFWSFYQNSIDTYRCGEVPSQLALPRALDLAEPTALNSLRTRLQSPWVDLDDVIEGDPDVSTQPRLRVAVRGYLDNPLEEQVFYRFELRWQIAGVQIPEWHVVPIHYYGSSRRWSNYVHFFDIPEGATHVQVGITVFDRAWAGEPGVAATLCHSHAPLLDDIVIGRTARLPVYVSNVDDDGPGSLRDAIETANGQPGPDRILFDVDGSEREIVVQSPLPTVEGPCVIDATVFPGHSGPDRVALSNGYSSFSTIMGLTLADSVIVRGLALHGFDNRSRTAPSAGLQILGTGNVVEDCWIGVQPDGLLDRNTQGILIEDDAGNNQIGGPEPGQGNVIQGSSNGISIARHASRGNTIRGNVIVNNARLAVDVGRNGSTANDPGDEDSGPNSYQNYPEITSALESGRIEGTLSSLPSTTYLVDLYRDTACGLDERGQGRQYLGWTEVTTDAGGAVSFVFELDEPLVVGEVIVATATDSEGSTSEYSTCSSVEESVTAVDGSRRHMRILHPNAPNPFNPRTHLRFTLATEERVRLEILDVAGRLVRLLTDGTFPTGTHGISWDGTDANGRAVASGVYLARLIGEDGVETQKMALVR